MSGFLYFVPADDEKKIRQFMKDNGLDYVFDDKDSLVATESAIDGKSGFIVERNGNPADTRYVPDEQDWLSIPKSHGCKVGVWRNNKPTPAELKKPNFTDSVYMPLRLLDGNEWTVPTARFNCDNETTGAIRKKIACDDEGHVIPGDFIGDGQEINDVASELVDSIIQQVKDNKETFDFDDRLPAKILSFNYRVSVREIVLLQLWSYKDGKDGAIVLQFVDFAGYADVKKNKASVI